GGDRAPGEDCGAKASNQTAVKRTATKTPEAAPVNGTSEHQSLSKYIQARFDECSRSQKDVAQYIVDHLDEAAFQTAEELARRANTSSSTVVRFSQALGFEGFPELQAAAREEYRRVHAKAAPNGTLESRPHRRAHARDRPLGGAPAPARRARDEARPPPQGARGGDHRRDPLGGRQARPHQALLLLQQSRLRALPHGAAEPHPGARLRRL